MYVYRGKNREPNEPTPAEQQQCMDGRKRELKPCGTDAAYQRHKKRGEEACDPCKDAHAIRLAQYRGSEHTGRRNNKPVCGTYSGAIQHRKKKEPVDFACRRAESIYRKQLRDAKKTA